MYYESYMLYIRQSSYIPQYPETLFGGLHNCQVFWLHLVWHHYERRLSGMGCIGQEWSLQDGPFFFQQ